jgi:hypothetical protein
MMEEDVKKWMRKKLAEVQGIPEPQQAKQSQQPTQQPQQSTQQTRPEKTYPQQTQFLGMDKASQEASQTFTAQNDSVPAVREPSLVSKVTDTSLADHAGHAPSAEIKSKIAPEKPTAISITETFEDTNEDDHEKEFEEMQKKFKMAQSTQQSQQKSKYVPMYKVLAEKIKAAMDKDRDKDK